MYIAPSKSDCTTPVKRMRLSLIMMLVASFNDDITPDTRMRVLQCFAVCCSVLQCVKWSTTRMCVTWHSGLFVWFGSFTCTCGPGHFIGHLHIFASYAIYISSLHIYISLLHTLKPCSTLQQTAAHCCTLLHTATQCCTLQHSVTQCCSLLQTAQDCNRLLQTVANCNRQPDIATHS